MGAPQQILLASAGSATTDANMIAGLHFDGADGSTTITDVKGHTWSINGLCAIDTGQSKFGGASLEGVGNTNYVESTHADYTPGSGDWTVEFWHRITNNSGFRGIFDMRPNSTDGLYLTIYQNGSDLNFFTNSANRITASGILSTGTWRHIAVSKASGTTRMFVDGTQVGSSYTDSNTYIGTRIRLLDFGTSANGGIIGHIDDLRYSRVARYTSNFTAPTAAFSDT